jgi:hypothetical protein
MKVVVIGTCYAPHHENVWHIGGIAPFFLHLSVRWRQMVSFMPWLLYKAGGGEWSVSHRGHILLLGKGPPVPIVQEAEWASELVWTQRLEEKSFVPAGDRTLII